MPIFPDDNTVRFHRLHPAAEQTPEIMGYLVRHIQPPAVYIILFDPGYRNVQQKLLHLGIGGIELRHIIAKGKHFIVQRFLLRPVSPDDKPVKIRRILSPFHHILKLDQLFTAMIKHCIQHHPDSPAVGLPHQPAKILIGAKMPVYDAVIGNIILMVGDGPKNRRQIQGVDP